MKAVVLLMTWFTSRYGAIGNVNEYDGKKILLGFQGLQYLSDPALRKLCQKNLTNQH